MIIGSGTFPTSLFTGALSDLFVFVSLNIPLLAISMAVFKASLILVPKIDDHEFKVRFLEDDHNPLMGIYLPPLAVIFCTISFAFLI